ncbi:MAG: ABC transporter substrate-binding protein, partial [Mycobacterium sp.]|nr:ABC transporter substrate-binding protein [Mycobacterium sp.]
AATAERGATNGTAAQRGGTLRAGLIGDVGAINPHVIGPQPLQTIFSIWDRLIAYDNAGKPQPMLAEAWDISSDQTQLKFNLRHGVQFHSGREVTSDDVKWNLLRVRNPAVNATQFNKQSQWFTNIDTSDKYAVVLSLDQPRPSILDFFELFNIGDPDTLDQQTDSPQWIGTGPFKLSDYKPGDHLFFSRNENYWRSGSPLLDEFDVSIMRDGSAASVQLEAGALDLVFDPPAQDVTRYTTDDHYGVYVNQRSGITGVMNLNTTVPPTNNKLFRQAVHYAINRARYVQTVLLGRGEPRSLPWTSASPAYDATRDQHYTFDLDKAKSLLAASGESLSQPIDFVFLTTEPPVGSGGLAQILQSDLASIGVTLNLRNIEFAALADTMSNLKYTMAYDAVFRYGEFEPSTGMTTSAQFNYEKNFAGFQNEQYTRLITSTQVEADPAKRQDLYTQLNDLLLDQCFSMPLATNPPIIATTSKVHNVDWNAHDQLVHEQLWMG